MVEIGKMKRGVAQQKASMGNFDEAIRYHNEAVKDLKRLKVLRV